MQKLKKILAQKAAAKLPEWPRYGDFRKVTQDPYYLKKCKGGTKENFSKIAQKRALDWKAQKHSGAANIILYLVCTWSAKTEEDFGAKSGSKTARIAKLWQFSQGHPKPAFSEKKQRGQKKILSSMQLRQKHWTRFWRKKQLQKSPNNQVMAIFASSPKTRIFWKSAKGGPREIFQKSPKK